MRRLGLLLAVLLAHAAPVAGDPNASAAASAPSAPAAPVQAVPPPEVPLPQLPPLPPISLPAAKPAAVETLDARLDELVAMRVAGPTEPRADFGFLAADVGPELVPAAAQRLDRLRRSLDGGAAKLLLDRARGLGKKALHKRDRRKRKGAAAQDKAEAEPDGDWLQFVLALHKPDSPAWRGLCELYGLLRVLAAVGTTPAFRELIGAYAHFGELVRIDLQRAIERDKDKAVPALIEARAHDAKKVRDFARRELDAIGRALPGEAVATADPDLLADVLYAFGRVRDVDAARVVLSFVAADKLQVRTAARAALGAIGEPAEWLLREAYESATGEKPPKSWDFRRLARELFRVSDRARATAVYALLEQGAAADKRGDHRAAAAAFDQLLARAPLFERRAEMAPAYLAYARELEKSGQYDDALVALRKGLRLDPDAADHAKTQARIAYLEGKTLALQGMPDPFILQRAVELDPADDDARALLASFKERTAGRRVRTRRYAAAAGVGILALLMMVWLAPRREAAVT